MIYCLFVSIYCLAKCRDEFWYMGIETEFHAVEHYVGLHCCHLLMVFQQCYQIAKVMIAYPYAQLIYPFLHCNDIPRVIGVDNGQAGRHIGTDAGRKIQIVPCGMEQVALVSAVNAMHPSRIVFREFPCPPRWCDMIVNVEGVRKSFAVVV